MKIFATAGLALMISMGVARAEKIDFSTMTCKQFLQSSKDGIGLILAWLDGYYHDEKDV